MMDQFFVYFSRFLGKPVVDMDGVCFARVYDLAFNLNNDIYPKARGVVVRRGSFFGRSFAEIAFADIERMTDKVYLKVKRDAVVFSRVKVDGEFELRRDVLDQQVVDIENKKVVRVNDVHLLKVESQYHIAHVDVGLRAMVRRLDWEPFVDFMMGLINPGSSYLREEELISWKNTQVLVLGSKKNVLKLDLARAKLAKIPPTALAEIMGDLDVFEQALLFRSLAFDVQQKVFADMAADDKAGLVDQLEDKEIVALIAKIPSDEAADFLMGLPKERMHQLLRMMETQTSKKLRTLLGFHKDSAGGLMATEFLSLRIDATVGDAINKVKASVDTHASLTTIYIVDENNKYHGTTTIGKFINEDVAKEIMSTCHPQKVFVRTDDGMEEVALLLEQYKYSAIPVLDANDVLVGSITVDDVMEELIALAWGKYKDQL